MTQYSGATVHRGVDIAGDRSGATGVVDELASQKLRLSVESVDRERLWADHNVFEGLFCALTAFAAAGRCTIRYPQTDLPESVAREEGYVFVPDWNRMGALSAREALPAVQGSQ